MAEVGAAGLTAAGLGAFQGVTATHLRARQAALQQQVVEISRDALALYCHWEEEGQQDEVTTQTRIRRTVPLRGSGKVILRSALKTPSKPKKASCTGRILY